MNQCTRCSQPRDLPKKAWCRKCYAEYNRQWRKKNPTTVLKYNKDYYARHAQKLRGEAKPRSILRGKELTAYIHSLKEGRPCVDCGFMGNPWQKDWDHVRGKKVDDVSHLRSKASIDTEIAKCDLVCACCHRERTYQRGRK